MNIITITLNPAFDLHFQIDDFKIGEENRVSAASISAGGKSVNISRALGANGVSSLAAVVMGQENAADFEAKLREEGIDYLSFPVPGRIRENITVHAGSETRISLDTFALSPAVLDTIYMQLHDRIGKDTIITLSGSLPRGVGSEEAIRFCLKLKELTRYLIVDSASLTGQDLVRIRPWLIKPNAGELSAMMGKENPSEREIAVYAEWLVEQGISQVLVTLGGEGAIYVGGNPRTGKRMVYRVKSAKVTPLSTVGAGDSTIAGYLAAFLSGMDLGEMLKTASAYGSAACLREGTAPPLPHDITVCRGQTEIEIF